MKKLIALLLMLAMVAVTLSPAWAEEGSDGDTAGELTETVEAAGEESDGESADAPAEAAGAEDGESADEAADGESEGESEGDSGDSNTVSAEDEALYEELAAAIRFIEADGEQKELGYLEGYTEILEADGLKFKDMNRNGELDVYEDWRNDAETRAADLASQLSLEQLAGLMLHQMASTISAGIINSQLKTQIEQGIRSFVSTGAVEDDVIINVSNQMQGLAEIQPFAIPIDRHIGATGPVSDWPSPLGIAATFDTEIMRNYANSYAVCARATGGTTTENPQVDITSDPRYYRFFQDMGDDPQLVMDMSIAYLDGAQSTFDEDGNNIGWGTGSIIAITKHFPGDGADEGGREGHGCEGTHVNTIYPNDNMYTMLLPFQNAIQNDSETARAVAIMPNYFRTFDENGDPVGGSTVGSAYNEYLIQDILRDELGFTGAIVTDYGVSDDKSCNGYFDLTEAERHVKLIENDVDEICLGAGFDTMMEAVNMYVETYGEEAAYERLQRSAIRNLIPLFNMCLFENPYLDKERSLAIIDEAKDSEGAHDAQLKSIIMLKNEDGLIHDTTDSDEKPTVYVPLMYVPAEEGMPLLGQEGTPASFSLPIDVDVLRKYVNIVSDKVSDTKTGEPDADGNPTLSANDVIRASDEELAKCDFAIVCIDSPVNVGHGYDEEAGEYIPVSLQYRPYTADSIYVRQTSIGGIPQTVEVQDTYGAQQIVVNENCSYYGKTSQISNEDQLDLVLEVASRMDNVIVLLNCSNPTIVSEFENEVEAIFVHFDADPAALCEIVTGKAEPSALLPFQMPASMEAVEMQYEDTPRDVEPYVDSAGNAYDFTFGLNWSGVIDDERVAKYSVDPLEG